MVWMLHLGPTSPRKLHPTAHLFCTYLKIGDDPTARICLMTVFELVNILNGLGPYLHAQILKKKKNTKQNRLGREWAGTIFTGLYFFPLLSTCMQYCVVRNRDLPLLLYTIQRLQTLSDASIITIFIPFRDFEKQRQKIVMANKGSVSLISQAICQGLYNTINQNKYSRTLPLSHISYIIILNVILIEYHFLFQIQ